MNISNYTNEVALNKLNELLLSKDLIRTISSCQNILLGSDIDDCLDKLEILSEYEIVSLNRLFLDEVYEKYSPQLETGTEDVTEVLPLLSCRIGEEGDVSSEVSRSATFSEYEARKGDINKIFSEFKSIDLLATSLAKLKKLMKEGLEKLLETDMSSNIDMESVLDLRVGVKGKFNITFSNLEADLGVALYIKSELTTSFGTGCSIDLLPKEIPKEIFSCEFPIPIGPISIIAKTPITLEMPLNISCSAAIDSNAFIGFVGIYGAGTKLGANYGVSMVKWFKIWKKWFYRPSVYFEPYASPYLINESNSYIGCITENEKDFVVLDNVSGNLSFSPTITFTPHLSFLGVVLGVESKAGIENNISLKFYTDVETLKQKTSGKGESKLFFKLNCFTGFFITLPFGFGTRGVNWSFDLMKPKEYKLCFWKF